MNDDHKKVFDELFTVIYKGNEDAKLFSFKLLEVAHTWDDIVDGDNPSEDRVNSAFVSCFYEFQRHPIWKDAGLDHHLLNVFFRWRDANIIEKDNQSTDDDLNKSYMLRAGVYDLFVIIAYHLYGNEWAAEIGPYVRKSYGETLKDYIKEVRQCQIQ